MIWIVVGAVAALLLAAVIRTVRCKAPAMSAEVPKADPEKCRIAGEKLGAMIRVPTVSRHEHEELSQFYRFHEVLAQQFPLVHTALEKQVLQGTLIYHWKGKDPGARPVLFMGHQDVVPASDEGWRVPAFSGQVVEGDLYGRGAMDCKGTMYVQLQAVEEMLAEGFVPPCDVYLEYAINEETGGNGAAAAMEWFRERGIRFALVLDEGGAVVEEAVPGMNRQYALLGITEKGYMDVKITAPGKGGHSSTPPRNSTNARLFAFAHEIERKRPFRKKLTPQVKAMFAAMAPAFAFPMRLLLANIWLFAPVLKAAMPKVSPYGEALLATTCCFTQMKGSDAANVIPKEPYLIANLRTSTHQNCRQSLAVLEKYGKKYGLTFEVLLQRDASPVSDIHGPAYGYVEQCIRSYFPDVGISPYYIMGGTDCRHFHALTEAALRFAPIRATTAQNNACHGIDENITLAALAEGVGFYKLLLRDYPDQLLAMRLHQ